MCISVIYANFLCFWFEDEVPSLDRTGAHNYHRQVTCQDWINLMNFSTKEKYVDLRMLHPIWLDVVDSVFVI